jgi:nucleoid-associated protein YgaU
MAMTRETKIGLLVGLAFIILFGIILSEKGTGRNEQFATPNPPAPLVELVPPTFTPPAPAESAPEEIMDSKVTMNDPEVKVTEKIETPGPSHMIIKQGQASDTQQPTVQQEISPKFKEMLPPTPTRALSQIPASSMPVMVQPAPLTKMEVEMVAVTEDHQAPGQTTQEAVLVAGKTQDHVVAPGETIASICRQYYPGQAYTMVSAVLKANNIANPQKLQVGQTLKLPNVTPQVVATTEQPKLETVKSALASSKLLTPVEDATIVGMINPNKTKVNVAVASNSESKTYTVQEKDTLTKIAKQFYGSEKAWTKIYEMNKKVLKNPHSLKSGINLKLPAVELAAGPKVD